MHIRHLLMALCLTTAIVQPAFATEHETHADTVHAHGGGIFHEMQLEMEAGTVKGSSLQRWELEGWIGTDEEKLWLKSEGERVENKFEEAELWVLYSRNVSEFWDAQAGIRYDIKPESTVYLAFGVNGEAPYDLETEAHLFISEHGDLTMKLKEKTDFFVTQQAVMEPYLEMKFSAQEVEEQGLGAGVTDGKIGLKTRYEITKEFAPYVDVYYSRKIGETASIAKHEGEDRGELVGAIGLRWMF